jgi:hypothetical protein
VAVAGILLAELAAARQAGATFENAWPDALDVALQGADEAEREEWLDALTATAESWREAWDRRPAPRAEVALAAVIHGEDREPVLEHECEHCGHEIPPARGAYHARYCGEPCHRAARAERAKAHAAA